MMRERPALTTPDKNGNYPEWYYDGRHPLLKFARFCGWLQDGCVEIDPIAMLGNIAVAFGVGAIGVLMYRNPQQAVISLGILLAGLTAAGYASRHQNMLENTQTVTRTTLSASPTVMQTKETTQTVQAPQPAATDRE